MNTVPYVIEQTSKGERNYDIFSRLLEDRIILLNEEVSNASSALVTAQLLYLEGRDPSKDISLYINSPGGSVSAGFAIMDTMNYIKCDVSTICMGMAASFGALLLTAGAKGKRFALPDSEIMIHQPSIMGDGMKGRASDIKIWSDYMQKNKQRVNHVLMQCTGRSLEEIERDTDRDHFMSAQEAKEYGLIDDVITNRELPAKL